MELSEFTWYIAGTPPGLRLKRGDEGGPLFARVDPVGDAFVAVVGLHDVGAPVCRWYATEDEAIEVVEDWLARIIASGEGHALGPAPAGI